eukprot:scaffold104009_cov35-Attheya_sp.AAC.2
MDRIPRRSVTGGPFSRAREWHSHTRSTTTRPRGGGGEVQHAQGTHRHQCHGPGRTPCKVRAPRACPRAPPAHGVSVVTTSLWKCRCVACVSVCAVRVSVGGSCTCYTADAASKATADAAGLAIEEKNAAKAVEAKKKADAATVS